MCNVYATACTFYMSFLPPFHSVPGASSSLSDCDGLEPSPILDTGATHTMLPLSWITDGEAKEAKKIHLMLADGSKARALLHNNLIYTHTAKRPLISVGQLQSHARHSVHLGRRLFTFTLLRRRPKIHPPQGADCPQPSDDYDSRVDCSSIRLALSHHSRQNLGQGRMEESHGQRFCRLLLP